jgi:hypothetical protein
MSFKNISAALDAHISTFATTNSIDVAWENIKYTQTNANYLQVTNIPGASIQLGIGGNGLISNGGIYMINIFTAVDKGKGPGLELVDLLANHFVQGSILSYNGTDVHIGNVSLVNGLNDGAFFYYTISVSYEEFSNGR